MSKVKTGHPKGLYVLFFTEMWERCSYYGMRALLVLYMTQHLLADPVLSENSNEAPRRGVRLLRSQPQGTPGDRMLVAVVLDWEPSTPAF